MPLILTLVCAGFLSLVLPSTVRAQRQVEPYQTFAAYVGWGAVRPAESSEIEGSAADADAGIYLGFDLEIRNGDHAYLYARLDADAARVRQHLALTGGVRIRPSLEPRLRPYFGLGAGLYWLEPKVDAVLALDREFAPRIEALAGGEWAARPGIRFFGEYRVSGARLRAVNHSPGCGTAPECVVSSHERVLHLGHVVWTGVRLKMF